MSKTGLKKELAAISKKLDSLHSEMANLRGLREAIRVKYVYLAFGVRVGSVVEDPEGRRYRVVKIDRWWGDDEKPWLVGNPTKKDGTFGKAERNIYDWTLVES